MKPYLEEIEKLIIRKYKCNNQSFNNTDIDVPSYIAREMVYLYDFSIDDIILFPSVKSCIFPYHVISKIIDKYKLDNGIFCDRDVLRIVQKNMVFCDTLYNDLFIDKYFNFKRRSYKSEIITEFYQQIKGIFIYIEKKEELDFYIINFFSKKYNLKEIEKNIEEIMLSEEYKNWIERCYEQIRIYNETSKEASRRFGEVFTPEYLVKEMVQILPKSDKDMRFLDPAAGTGIFGVALIQKLMEDLVEDFPDEESRKKHILEKMIVQCELQVKNAFINYYILDPEHKYDLKIFRGSFLTDDYININPLFLDKCKEWGIDHFDVSIGNPPYQKNNGGGGNGSSADPIYNIFIEKNKLISNNVIMITPSRWFVMDKKGMSNFRKFMIEKLQFIKHFDYSSEIFESVVIKGGVSYFLLNDNDSESIKVNGVLVNKKIMLKNNIIFLNNNIFNIIEKIKNNTEKFFDSVVESRNYFGKVINGKKTLQNGKECISEKMNDDYLKCYVSKKEGFVKYISSELVKNENIYKYKVLTTKGTNVGEIGNTFMVNPNEVCSETYLVILSDDKNISENILNFMKKTKLFKFLYKLKNTTQNSSKDTFKYIPYMDFSKTWNDEELYEHFGLSVDEIDLIEKTIK